MQQVYQRTTKTNEAGSDKNIGQGRNGTEMNDKYDLPDIMEMLANIYKQHQGDILSMGKHTRAAIGKRSAATHEGVEHVIEQGSPLKSKLV